MADGKVRQAYLCAKQTLDEMKELPVRVDKMTKREYAIYEIASDLCGSMKFIKDTLEPLCPPKQEKKEPEWPYVFVINDTVTMMRHIAAEAGVRFQVGKHQGGDKGSKGFFVHFDDVLKLKKWFFSTGQRAEAEWTQEAYDDAKKIKKERKINGD